MSNVIAIAGGADHALALRTGPRTLVMTLLPTDQYQIAGGNVTFNSRGAGLYNVGYQWKSNGVAVAGATNQDLTLADVQASFEAGYSVTVSNEIGTLASSNANLYLVGPPIILSQSQPTNPVVVFHQTTNLSIVANGTGQMSGFPLAYQWAFNGTNISGATSNNYTIFGESVSEGVYTVTVTNAAGSTNASWQVSLTYSGTYLAPDTLAYHLATNAVGRTNGFTPTNMVELTGWSSVMFYPSNFPFLTNSTWSTNFWLRGVQGLSATSIGYSNGPGGQGAVTMVSPRHFLFAHHVSEPRVIAFLDTNNVVYWRSNVESVQVSGDIQLGILDADLPGSVGYLPVAPANLSQYLPTNAVDIVQGIGMDANLQVFSQPMIFTNAQTVVWNRFATIPLGLGTEWSLPLPIGNSSAPERILVGNQLVALSHNEGSESGPSYSFQFEAINQTMHYLSTNNNLATDYQLTPFSLTNWPPLNGTAHAAIPRSR